VVFLGGVLRCLADSERSKKKKISLIVSKSGKKRVRVLSLILQSKAAVNASFLGVAPAWSRELRGWIGSGFARADGCYSDHKLPFWWQFDLCANWQHQSTRCQFLHT
jgi:hypothetical protein